MKQFLAKVANKALTSVARKMALTNCWTICHRPEAPDELFK